MSDIWTKSKRSEVMSKIRSASTKPEKIVRSFLFNHGLRFRLNVKSLPGKPDLVLKKYGTVIFVNGCFWHLHKNCSEGRIPNTNRAFWKKKLENNVNRDRININELGKLGWKVIVVWECEIEKRFSRTSTKIIRSLR